MVAVFDQAFRRLWRDKGFAVAFLLVLALGLGLNGAIFAAFDSYALQPLPLPQAGRLRTVFNDLTAYGWRMPPPAFGMSKTPGVVSAGRYHSRSEAIEVGDQARSVKVCHANYGFFRTLEVQPLIGHWIGQGKKGLKAPPEIVLSYWFWQSAFSGDRDAIGKVVRVSGRPYTVVGVMPPSFGFPEHDEAGWLSFVKSPISNSKPLQTSNSRVLLRLGSGASTHAVQTALSTRRQDYLSDATPKRREETTQDGSHLVVTSLNQAYGAQTAADLLRMQLGALLLLILCVVSLVGLAMNRHIGRRRELAVRATLGATRINLVLLTATETAILAVVGGLMALAISYAGLQLFRLSPIDSADSAYRVVLPSHEWILLGGASVTLCAFSMLAPFAVSSWRRLMRHLREAGGSELQISAVTQHIRRVLTAAQIAVAVVILVLAGLLGLSMLEKLQASNNIRGNDLFVATLSLRGPGYQKSAERVNAWRKLRQGLASLPGIKKVGIGEGIPFTHELSVIALSNTKASASNPAFQSQVMSADPKALRLLGLKLLSGRLFTKYDMDSKKSPVIVDSYFAKKLFGTTKVVGKMVYWQGGDAQIIGVVQGINDRYRLVDIGQNIKAAGTLIFPPQLKSSLNSLLIGFSGPAKPIRRELRRSLSRILPGQAYFHLDTMREDIRTAASKNLDLLVLFAAFGIAALALSTVGVFALISQIGKQREREYALRRALGATDARVKLDVMRSALLLWLTGGLAGVIGAIFSTRLLSPYLYDVQAIQVGLYAAVLLLIGLLVLIASWIPANRACKQFISQLLTS